MIGAENNETRASITDSKFHDNQAIGGAPDPGVDGGLGVGGAIAAGGPTSLGVALTIHNSTFSHNQATGSDAGAGNFAGNAIGGAIINGLANSLSTTDITNSTFVANQAVGGTGYDGGWGEGGISGALNCESPSAATVANCSFIDNRAVGGGAGGFAFSGAIQNQDVGNGADMIISHSTFTGNEALGTVGGDGVNAVGDAASGAIDNNGNLTIVASTFIATERSAGAVARCPHRRFRLHRRWPH